MKESEFLTLLGAAPTLDRMREVLAEYFHRIDWHDAAREIERGVPDEYESELY